jgi:hypothetical protein
MLLHLLLLLILLTAIELSLGSSSPYTSTTKQIRINIHKINNTKHSKYKYTHQQNTHTLHSKLKQTQYKKHTNEIGTIQSLTLSIKYH